MSRPSKPLAPSRRSGYVQRELWIKTVIVEGAEQEARVARGIAGPQVDVYVRQKRSKDS